MDWLTFKFCVFIWAFCVSNSQTQLINSSTSIITTELRTTCIDDQPVASPDQCNTCICYAGVVYCTHLSCLEQECEGNGEVSKPDPCNKCVCRRGKVTCSDRICIPAFNCVENELYPAQDECNACVCMNGFISCTTNPCDEEIMHTTPLITSRPKKKRKCVEGTRIAGPNDCTECICRNGKKRCKHICNKPKLESRFKDSDVECVSGQHIQRPDECNNCICFEGQIHCTHMPCTRNTRIDRECTDDQPVFRPDECNECYCFEGKLECSDLICIRGSKCVEGEEIPKPDGCNACKCVEGHILCTDYQCPIPVSRNTLSPDVQPLVECQEGDVIPPPLPPNDCNTCICMENTILCSANTCVVSVPEITGRLGEQEEQTDLNVFDKQISMEPFVSMLSKHYVKSPTKLIHTHAYNGFHQEIKVHSSNLPKDATQLLRVLATTLDNSALASISKRLSSSGNDDQDQTNVTSKETLVAQSSKLITSGSRSNETILVVPNPELLDNQNSQSVLPLITKHETTWKSVSGPAPLLSTNNVIYQHDPKGKPAQLGNPGLSQISPPKPTPVIGEIPKINTPSIYQTLKPTLINKNDGKMSYTPFPKESSPFNQPHPFRPTQPGPNIYNFSSPYSLQKPGNFIVTLNNNGGQQTPPQSQFVPNPPKFYAKQVQPQQFQLKPTPNLLPTVNNNGNLRPPAFPNKPNQPIVSANQFKPSAPPLFGLKSGQGSIGPLNNKGNQSDQQFKSKHPQNFQINPPRHNQPAQQSISYRGFDNNDEIPTFAQFKSDSPNILITPQNEENSDPTQHKSLDSQFDPNSSTYYTHEYESPNVNDLNSDEKQLKPYSITSYIEHHQTPPSFLNKTNKGWNVPTHSHYTKHTTITYISEYDSAEQSNPSLAGQDLNQQYNAPYNNEYESYLTEMPNTDYGSLESDEITPKVNYYLNLPNLQLDQSEPYPKLTKYYLTHNSLFPGQRQNDTLKVHPTLFEVYRYDQHGPWNKSNHLFDTFIDPSSDGSTGPINFYQNRTNPLTSVYPNIFADDLQSPYKSLFKFPQDQYKKGGFNKYGSPEGLQFPSNLVEDPAHPTEFTQNHYTPGVFYDDGSINGFKHPHNIYEDPRQLKPIQIETLQNPNSLQYPSNSTEDVLNPQFDQHKQNFDPAHPQENLHDPLNFPSAPSQNQQKPGVLDNREVNDRYKYGHNAYEIPRNFKPVHKLPQSSFDPILIQNTTGMFNEPGSADAFQITLNSTANPVFTRGNQQNLPLTKLGPSESQHLPGLLNILHKRYPSISSPTQNQHSPAQLDDSESANGFHYLSDSAGDSTYPRGKPFNSPFGSSQTQSVSHLPGVFDDHTSGDYFSFPSDSAEDSIHPTDKSINSLFAPTQNQNLPGIFDNSASPDDFYNPSDSDGYSTHPRYKPLNSPFGSTQNKPASHFPGLFDDRAFGDYFSFSSNSAEEPKHSKDKLPKSLFSPNQNLHVPGTLEGPASPDGFQNPSNSSENPTHLKGKPTDSQFSPIQNQHIPGILNAPVSADGSQYPPNSTEIPTHPKLNQNTPALSQFNPTQNQRLPGVLDKPASNNSSNYLPNSAEILTHPKHSQFNPGHFQFTQSQSLPTVLIVNRSISVEDSTDSEGKPPNFPIGPTQAQNLSQVYDDNEPNNGSHYLPNSAKSLTHPKLSQHNPGLFQFFPFQNPYLPWVLDDRSNSVKDPKNSKDKQPNSPLGSTQNQDLSGVYDDRESVEGYIFESAENPPSSVNDPYTIPNSKFKQIQNQPKPSSLNIDIVSKQNKNQPENKSVLKPNNLGGAMYSNMIPLKPSLFDSLFNGVNNIPWLLPKDSNNVTSASKPGIQFDHDQYKPSFFDHVFKGVPWLDPNLLNQAIVYYTEITPPPSELQVKQDMYKPSTNQDPLLTIPNQNGNTDTSDADPNGVQTEPDMSTPSTTLIKSYSTQDKPLLYVKHIGDSNSLIPIDADTITVYDDQLSPLYKAPKKLKPLLIDKSESGVDSTDQLNILPFLFPGTAKTVTYEPSSEQDDESTPENNEFKVPKVVNGVLDWLQGKVQKYIPAEYNSNVTKNGTKINKIFSLLTKLTPSEIKHSANKLKIPYSSSNPKVIEYIASILEEDAITTTQSPSTDDITFSFEDRFQTVPTALKDKELQASQYKYPEVHIILHQGDEEDDEDLATHLKTHAESLFTDTGLEGSGAPSLAFKSRLKHLPKDHKEECGDETHWITNCHGCSCYFGQAMCFKIPDCELRRFGEPMTCKPYSHFKLGECYTCECNGDGVAECDATDCKTEPSIKSAGTTDSSLPAFTEFFDDKKANDVLQYYSSNKKLLKDCPNLNSQTPFPTCEQGTSWVSSCHKCECDENGKHRCIKIDSCKLDYDSYGKPSQCKPNSKFYPKTNSLPCVECTCNDEGISYCPGSDNKTH